MRRECTHCGSEDEMPFTCRYCGQPYCSSHRLPENHDCDGLEDYKERLRDEGKLMSETPEVKVRREIDDPGGTGRRGGRGRGGRQQVRDRASQLMHGLRGKVTWIMLGAMVAVTLGGWIASSLATGGWIGDLDFTRYYVQHFALGTESWRMPWTLVTSVFAHGSFGHLFINGIILFFFGPALEQRIGSKAFAYFFLVTGIIAGVAQVLLGVGLVATGVTSTTAGVLGASGAIMGILGALTILAPDAKVLLFFVLPIPLWVLTIGYIFIDLGSLIGGILGGTVGGVANLAHLTGLAIGLYMADRYWKQPRGPAMETWGM